ncbi:hypothetical protein H6F61_26780 [Cyanobacteria bacterium FACHB-472]|nr:hypothetical protein [Cyanobacteria bacterium FACHB-472]
MQPLRQVDVLLIPASETVTGVKLAHLTLAEAEVTGHRHRITQGEAELYAHAGTPYLKVLSPTALLTHKEHQPITIPKGDWMVRIQREYEPKGWRYVAD